MKKLLFGTSALVAAGMLASAPAIAAEMGPIKLNLGGYMEQWAGFTSNESDADEDYSGFDVISDSEVFFKGSVALDNGLTVGADMQLEGNVSGDQIDESYAWVSGAFGQIILGTENSAMYKLHVSPSDFGIGVNSGDVPNWTKALTDGKDRTTHAGTGEHKDVTMKAPKITAGGWWRRPFGSTNVEPGNDNDSGKLSYFTPRIEGLQLGVSYAGDPTDDGGFQNREGGKNSMVAVGLNFARAFEGANVNASVGYGSVDSGGSGDSPTAMSAGLKVNVGGFGAGASYGQSEDDGAVSGAGYNVGVNYTTGPMGVSLVYFHGEQDGDGTAGHGVHDTVMLSGKYAMGPGITLKGTVANSSIESDDAALVGDYSEANATYVVVGLALSF
jgi:outer membrane protein OmpU